ncbi:MAG: MarR family transcriptional regulator [Burkholderiaceae bacterium]|nr:MarR family transcriptional regulator [Burkholderiaceae bacterium]
MNDPVQLELRLRRTGGGRINPHPRGSMSPLSCPAQVAALLAGQPRHWWAFGDLAARVTHPKALTWALGYLRNLGWLERGDDPRSARYLRYRITPAGLDGFSVNEAL